MTNKPFSRFRTLEYQLDQLEHSARHRSAPYFFAVLNRKKDPHPKIVAILKKLKSCKKRKTIYIHGYPLDIKRGCGLYCCPACIPRQRYKEGKKVQQAFFQARPHLHRSEMSFITINGDTLRLGSDFKPSGESLWERLRAVLKRYIEGSLFFGEFHIGQKADWSGMLHIHGWLHHPGYSRQQVKAILTRTFVEKFQVNIRPPRGGDLAWQMTKSGMYASDPKMIIKGHGDQSPDYLHDWILSYESLRSRGRVGLRCQYGFRKGKNKSKKIVSKKSDDDHSDEVNGGGHDGRCVHLNDTYYKNSPPSEFRMPSDE
jgi:hypothetical protein